MSPSGPRILAAACLAAVLAFASSPALAQSGEQKPERQQQGDTAKEGQKTIAEFAEAARAVAGPAGRVVGWLWSDDLDTAFRHLDLYDRFGCPGGHIQAAFRCVVRQGAPDRKTNEPNNARVHACWIDPALQPAAAAAPSAPTGTTTR
jgi:hypothetical protein